MAKDQTRRLKPSQVVENTNAFSALKAMPSFNPVNQNYLLNIGQGFVDAMNNMRSLEAQAEAALKAARDNANQAEWNLHNYMLGAKDQVIAQYGSDSNELQSLGLKKKSEYKSPIRKPKKTE